MEYGDFGTGSNEVHIIGTVKRTAKASMSGKVMVMSFCLVVREPTTDRYVMVDCYAGDAPSRQLEGFVDEGEKLEVYGCLSFRTLTDKFGNKRSVLTVHVTDVYEMDEE
jgi:hypothetical protein